MHWLTRASGKDEIKVVEKQPFLLNVMESHVL